MTRKPRAIGVIGILAVAVASSSASIPCDRACLEDVAYQYPEDMVAHDTSRALYLGRIFFYRFSIINGFPVTGFM